IISTTICLLLIYFALKEVTIPSRRAHLNSARAPSIPQPDYESVGFGQQISCRDLDKIALTVPSGNPVLLAIFCAPIPASWFSERTVRTVFSGRGGLPSLLPLARATLSPAIVRSDIRALSCLASVANIEIITSLNGPVESSHCFDRKRNPRPSIQAAADSSTSLLYPPWSAGPKPKRRRCRTFFDALP